MTAHLVRYRDARDAAVVCWVKLLPALRDMRHEAHLSLTRAALLDRLVHATERLDDAYTAALYERTSP